MADVPDEPVDELLRQRLNNMQEDELLKFLRESVVRLDAATTRLETLAATREDGSAGKDVG